MTAPPELPAPVVDPVPPPRLLKIRSVATTGLFILAVFYTLHLGRPFFLPLVLAFFLAQLLRPMVRALTRWRLPAGVASGLVVLLLVGVVGAGFSQLWGPAADWVARAPRDLDRLEVKLKKLLRSVEQVTRTAQQVDEITDVAKPGGTAVELKRPSLLEVLFGGATSLLAITIIVLVLTYFFLSAGDQFLRKLPRVLPRGHAERVLGAVHQIEGQLSRYFLAVSIINLSLGTLTAIIMAMLGMPTPVLLGAAAAALNFLPYLGPAVMVTLLVMVALLSLPSTGAALIPPALYLLVHVTEANVVTPQLLGRRLPLNPTAIFVGFLFWWWLWGVPGALLSVPILVTLKAVCDQSEGLKNLGEVIGR
ncbi:MAG: AI-2E family transporter [Gemmatimonadales bacterium]